MSTTDSEEKKIISENELPPNLKVLWDKAIKALRAQNYDYVTQLIAPIVKEQPMFLDGRRVLRKCQMQLTGDKKKSFLSGGSIKAIMKLKPMISKDPLNALDAIEAELAHDPTNHQLNEIFYEAAMAAHMPDLAVFGLDTLRTANPNDKQILKKIADHYIKVDQPHDAKKAYEAILKIDGSDLDAVRGLTRATAQDSMKKQNWEGGGDKRDDDLRKELELMERKHLTADQIERQLTEFSAQYEADPNNIKVVKRIASLYEMKKDLAQAITFFEWAFTLSQGDVALAAHVRELKDKYREEEFAQMSAEIESNPDAPDIAEKRQRLEELRAERLHQKVDEARKAVNENPTDPSLRYFLAEQLFNVGEINEAIPELQRAKQNPHVRTRALLLLGRCFAKKNMLDLAVNQFSEAEADITGMSAQKMDIIYERAMIHEKLSAKDPEHSARYIEALKQIMETDYGYRDVAQRVEASYA